MPSSTSSSEPKGEALVAPAFEFDGQVVNRLVPARPWRLLAAIAIVAVILLAAVWEIYWRGKMFIPGDYKNNAALWAQERRKADGDATVIIGSSRVLFDIDLDIWEELSGVRPVQLALEGTSPRIFLKNLADDEDFQGLVVVGITAPLFFTQEGGLRADVINYAHEQTPAQRFGYLLSIPLEETLAYFEDQTRPKRQMTLAPLPLRKGMKPRFDPRKLEILGRDRNAEMWRRVVDDKRYREEAKAQWMLAFELFAPPPGPDGAPQQMPDVAINAVIAEVKESVDKIRARGGDVAFVRAPYDGAFAQVEDNGFPRQRFWDRLVAETDSAGVTFQDYPEMQGLHLPEWSHLAPPDAKRFTRALTPAIYARLEEKKAARGN